MIAWLAKLRNLDRRWLYLAMLLALVTPLVLPVPIPTGGISPPARQAFDLLGSCPPDKVVLIDSSWDAGSASENRFQLEVVLRHLCSQRIKFVFTSIAVTPFGPEFAQKTAEAIVGPAGYVYGTDWVNLGYVAGPPTATRGAYGVLIEAMCRDLHGRFPTDYANTPLDRLPLMAHVHSYRDIHAFGVITYQANDDWLAVMRMFDAKLWVGCMSIVGPYFYPFLDSGQLAGMLAGTRGAAEYEHLLGRLGQATQFTMAGAFGNCVIIVAALLGNVGWWADRRRRRGVR